jgi:NAD(P)-dependent dehydrogenase (short-subunit alcohol dehydrogenase family)
VRRGTVQAKTHSRWNRGLKLEASGRGWSGTRARVAASHGRSCRVSPGATRTRIGVDAFARFPGLIPAAARNALRRMGEPDDIGMVIATLLSEESRWINARNIEVSGAMNL